ncbi:MAG: hybrid sensor histidine kinase/response regulator [Vicinamibacteria bacterium]
MHERIVAKGERRGVDRPLEWQQTEERLARLAAIVDCSDDAIASKTLEGIITSWNKAAEKIFGYTSAEAVGQPITIIIPRERHSEAREVLKRIVRGEIVDHFETVRMRKDGSLVDISLTVSPIKDHEGRTIGASKIARDITAQKRAERELKALYREAEQANRAKDEFLAMMGHELRNPLGAISNSIHLLDQDGSEVVRFAREVILRQTRSLTRLIDDLLDMGRMMTGKILLRKTALDLSRSVGRAVASMRASGRFKLHDVSLELEPAWVEADEVRVEQIVANLVGNAVKYTPAGGSIRISVGTEKGDSVLRVEDDGIGVPDDLLSRIFDLFVQGERSLDRTDGGLGIGLSMVRRLAELHGGSAEAFSLGPDRGSRFTVRLPAIPAPSVVSDKEHAANRTSKGLRILVVEDNRDALDTLKMLLSAAGHEVKAAMHGREALESASRIRPEVAIVDLGLPGMDGYEIARRLRERETNRDMLLIALTGYGSAEDRKRTREAGFDAHLLKPLDYEELTSLLQE